MRTAYRRALAGTTALLATAALSACGNDDDAGMPGHNGMGMSSRAASPSASAPQSPSTGTPASGPHNQADVTFATDMIPHHAQALVMADMALVHGTSPDFRALATAIKAAQKPEIDQMSGWLVGWGEQVPDSGGHGGHMGMGMMSDQDLDDLSRARGSGFESMWLRMMIEHHEGAIEMSQTELRQGSNAEAKELAQSIITSQSAEIEQMEKMLDARAG
jgi:uncharacterized protein (DUF305 family)